jgi:hypothetical protein
VPAVGFPAVEVRDWVVRAAGQQVSTVQGALAALNTLDSAGNWSVEEEDGQWYLFTGDQWIGRAATEAEFASFVAGVAAATAIAPEGTRT